MPFHRTLAAAVLGAALCSPLAWAADPLPALGADPAQTSVSGLSSGAFMAVQYQVAYSGSVVGAGVVAGGPYYCAAGSLYNTGICMGQVPFVPPNPALMVSAAKRFASNGQIDPLDSMQRGRIYVFSGTKDTIVYQQAVDATVSFFKQAGVPGGNISYVNTVPAGHALITPSFGNDCPANAAPYISHCTVSNQSYDQPGALLSFIYGSLNPPASQLGGKIITFNQREFAAASTGMADDAYAYVPQSCAQGTACRVHVAFHGCKQSANVVGDDFYEKTSYNSWADANNIVVLYPQVNASSVPYNPQGCWDWFGYTGQNYAMKSGSQMVAVNAMINRLTSKR
ncbi:depolymerase [Burkholderia stagnalis]|uniref:extracellular catalytic domain type 2 short-chain-length polyhydroxyalkanoate depolymerase n=1 Tax=Burkholderia stagnalis TaxID=1503054 RepID=UPI000F5A0E12|nr:PHB depolymerase family esterase [Burkholderia stagnalis]RQQ25474.1 depolymerase [Burkholderia stagnalis]RQY49191.1 depolymerase [Burkholderia stagnalis]